ncbi:hypothetical protein JB92DRAFT_3095281 [Gautieria morchelliformis]|nr:hypothetical protein JB92DRAFT_3095281 [Gautieria morchelliformis]
MHAGLSPPKLHHSGSPILLPPLCFTPHPANHREFHDTCPPPAAPACAEPACVALLPSPIGIALPPTGRPGESIPTPPPFMLQPRPNPAPPAGSGVTRAVQGTIGWMGYLSGRVGIALRDAVVYRLFRFTIGQTLVLRDTADCSGESDLSNVYLQIPMDPWSILTGDQYRIRGALIIQHTIQLS